MKLDSSVNRFVENPNQFLLKVETKGSERIVKAEEKGVWTWIKAHLPSFLFGDYNLKRVIQTMGQVTDPRLISSLNIVIKKYNDIHAVPEVVTDRKEPTGCWFGPERAAPIQQHAHVAVVQDEQNPQVAVKLPLDDILNRARERFVANPDENAIVSEVEKYFQGYDPANQGVFVIRLEKPQDNRGLSGIDVEKMEITHQAKDFLLTNKFPGINILQ